MHSPARLAEFLDGRLERVLVNSPPEDAALRALFPGSFNPLHAGHRAMARIAAEKLGAPIAFEISVTNVDKPPLDEAEIRRRLAQFQPGRAVWLTRAPTFVEKSALFPGATFIAGADTLARLADVRYYGDDGRRLTEALATIAARGCRFLVFCRVWGARGSFRTLDDLPLPDVLRAMCDPVPPAEFRDDISSTELRRARGRS